MASLKIRLFGCLTVEHEGEDRSSLYSGRLRGLLTLLLLQAGVPQSRQSLAFTLWPDSTEKQARTNLRKLLLLLRGALGSSAHLLVHTDQNLYWQRDDSYWLDSDHFTRTLATAAAAKSTQEAIALYSQAVELYRGDLLADCYDEWVLAVREGLRDQFINALEQLCTLYEAERRYAEGVAAARRLLQHDPVYERGHLHLMRLQALMNDRAAALQTYHRCATLLRRELGVDPSPAVEELYLQLLDHDLSSLETATAAPSSAIPLVGRRFAWQQLLERWQHVRSGRAHFTLIAGEAGIGKSRLAEEMMVWVERQGIGTAHARAYGSDNRTLTYAPIARWLRVPLIRNELARLDPYWLTEIARLLPELLLERDDIRPPQPMVDDWQRHHLVAALVRALQPERQPRLLVLDDLQWCDGETLAWLPRFLEATHDQRLLVVGTVRSEEFDDYDALQTMCDTLRRRGQLDEITLGPLDAAETAELAQHVARQPLAAPQAQWLMQATEGNPLFVIETAQLIHDEGASPAMHSPRPESGMALPPTPPTLPQSVLAVIEARLGRLSKPARAVAEVAATIGRSFDFPVLAAATALDEDALVDALDELWRRRIIRERTSDAYDFSHDRIRDVAYAGSSRTRLRLLHKRVAAAIAQTHRGALDEVSGELGYHYEQAGERLAAIEHYMQAAALTAAQYAHHETGRYLDRVLALALPEETAIRFEALLCRDRMLEHSGTITLWRENVRRLSALAEMELSDPLLAAARRALSAERSARLLSRNHEYALAIVHARQATESAALTGDIALQALCHYSLGLRVWFVADFAAAVHHLEQAIALARQVDDSEILATALETRAQTYMFNGGKASQIEPLLEESLFHYDKAGSLYGRSQILNKLAYIQFAQGTGIYEGACEQLREAIALARRMASPSTEVTFLRNLAITLTCMGNYAPAEECLQQAQALLYAMGKTEEDPVLLNYAGFLSLNQGRLADALDKQQKALAGLTALSHAQWRVKALTALGWINLRLQNPEQARTYLQTAISECRRINEQRQLAYALVCRGTLHTEDGQRAAAGEDFAEARAILYAYEMPNRAQEAEAGLAYVAFLAGDTYTALTAARAILMHLEQHPVDFTEDVCQLLMLCGRILSPLDPAAAQRLGVLARCHLATRTATLDPATQELFWEIPAHQEVRATYQLPASPRIFPVSA